MFTPQKLWSLTQRSESGKKNGTISGQVSGFKSNTRSPTNGETLTKGKAFAFLESDGNMEQESLSERVSKLENELFEYQYNMGLLLIEKKEWAQKYEEIKEASVEAADALKREQSEHLIVMSEVEKREENLKKALGVERQCRHELEKALREMRSEYAEIKFNADSKLAEANALVASVEEKSWEVEAKFHAADTKLVEVSRKSSEIERKLHELEAQESAFRRERSFFTAERETHENALSEKREDLREWEQKLQEAEERLADGRRLLNQREERANENDKILKKKQNDLEESQKKIEVAYSTLKTKEEDISTRIASLAFKEKEADDLRKILEVKEKQLLELEEKLNARERLEIQKLLDAHQTVLAQKQEEFELEVKQKRVLHDEQLKNKVVEVEKKEAEIMHMEEKVKKREQATEKKLEKVREKEMDIESKLKALKEREKSLKVEEKILEKDRKKMLAEKEELLSMKAALENVRADIEKKQLRLDEERERLKITEDERLEHARLKSELKQEIEKCRFQNEQLVKEADELKQEKEKFEKGWEELDDKRAEIKRELQDVFEQKQYLEKFSQSEEERLNNEKQEMQQYIQRELELLKLEKDNFTANIEHEKSILAEKYRSEKSELLHDFEMRKQELESEMQRKQEEMESSLHEREKSFEKERESELNNINYLREMARREMEEMKLEKLGLDKEKLEISENKKHVEAQQLEMKKDIEELVGLSQKLKDQREHFIKERERFLAFAEKQKSCNICGETIREFMLSDLHPLLELKNLEAPPQPRVVENYLEVVEGTSERLNDGLSPSLVNSGCPAGGGSGTISWLRKCTSKIFKFSPGKKLEFHSALDAPGASAHFGKQVDVNSPKTLPRSENFPEPSLQIANDSFDVQIIESDSGIREVETVQALSVDQNVLDTPENSQNSGLRTRRHRPGKRGKPRASRTVTVKSVTTGSNPILGQSTEKSENQYINGDVENSVHTNEESQADFDLVEIPTNRRKRSRVHVSQATASDSHSEGHSGSVKDGDHRKRRQRVVAAEQSFGEKRYNLRRSSKSVATVANGSLAVSRKGNKKETDGHIGKEEQLPGLETSHSEHVGIGGASKEEILESGATAKLPRGFECREGDEPARCSEDASDLSLLMFKCMHLKKAGGSNDGHVELANASVAEMVLSEEVSGSALDRDDNGEELNSVSLVEEEENEDDGDEDEIDHPGEVSIGKKLWTFLTT